MYSRYIFLSVLYDLKIFSLLSFHFLDHCLLIDKSLILMKFNEIFLILTLEQRGPCG